MNDKKVLQVKGVGKCFKIYDTPWHRALEWATLGKHSYHTNFWAIQDISFELRQGEFLGIIGINSAGKSTLLKIITGVLSSTEGSYHSQGRILPLLELGVGLNETLTGRENVKFSAELLNFPPGYAEQRMAQIADFSELGPFFDRQVATYSTGMRMRLAFSLFAFLDCDVLILDEVMAVGDIFFQQKCYARLEELIAQNTSIILVSHDLNAIQQFCDTVVVLHQGKKVFQGPPTEAISTYIQVRGTQTAKAITMAVDNDDATSLETESKKTDKRLFVWPPDEMFFVLPSTKNLAGSHAHLIRVALCDESGRPNQAFRQGHIATFYYEFYLDSDLGVAIANLELTNTYNLLLHSKTSLQHKMTAPNQVKAGSRVRFRQTIEMNLAPGDYVFTVGLSAIHPELYGNLEQLSQQEINTNTVWACRVTQVGAFVITRGLAVRHGGLCDLPGDCQLQIVPPASL